MSEAKCPHCGHKLHTTDDLSKNAPESPRYYGLEEVGKMLSTSRATLWRWIRDGRIKAVKFNGDERSKWRISEDEISRFINKAVKS